MEPRIDDLAVLGDGQSAALVGRDGAVVWLCWPRFDSPALFASLLDPGAGGALKVHPVGAARTERAYIAETNVLVTRFATRSGTLVLTDFLAIGAEDEKGGGLFPAHELLRVATCESGETEVEIEVDFRPAFGTAPRRLRDAGKLGIRLERGAELFTLRASIPLAIGADGVVRGRARMRAGDELQLSLAYDDEGPAVLPPLGDRVREALRRTIDTWQTWARRARYDGPYRDAVVRSALALKLLTFAPSGAIVAAPTTSLPERIGGDLNWDYRFCWLRDASLTVRALFGLGYEGEAEAFVSWLIHSTRLTRPELRVLYDVYGETPRRERELALSGYRGSRPVRVGNAAVDQLQLDTYGEVIDAVAQVVRRGGRLDGETQELLRDFGTFVCHEWERPDSGIWEPREPPTMHTHSLVLAWTALDRLVELYRRGAVRRLPVDRFEYNCGLLRSRIEREGWNPSLGSYTAELGGDTLDSALLLLPWYGYVDARSPRMRGTWRRIVERLCAGPGLVYRYERSRRDGESAFGICSFWAADYLARGGGSFEEARAWFEHTLGYGNDLGLFAEEIDPETGEAVGNFPQAFTHVGLLDAAISLDRRARSEREVTAPRSVEFGEVRP